MFSDSAVLSNSISLLKIADDNKIERFTCFEEIEFVSQDEAVPEPH